MLAATPQCGDAWNMVKSISVDIRSRGHIIMRRVTFLLFRGAECASSLVEKGMASVLPRERGANVFSSRAPMIFQRSSKIPITRSRHVA